MTEITPPKGIDRRTIVPADKYFSEQLSPGVTFGKFYPGGKEGPNREVHFDKPGGQTWTEYLLVGGAEDPFHLLIPDIRMPANQYWPLHWHDCWTVVLILEGSCTIGDWHMAAGDIFIVEPSIEYGPLIVGPHGCRLLEIFARAQGATGGYAPEYHDHPTLQGIDPVFRERSALNKRNNGNQVLSVEGVAGFYKARLNTGGKWHFGPTDDPDNGFMCETLLAAGEHIPAHQYSDWRVILVLDGSVDVCGRQIEKDGYLLIAPGSPVESISAGPNGAQLLELARSIRGEERLVLSQV